MKELYDELTTKNQLINSLNNDIENSNRIIEDLRTKIISEATFILENKHLREDNTRLVTLLKGTKNYKDFAEYIEDSNGTIKLGKRHKSCNRKNEQKENVEDWVPIDAFKIAQGLKCAPLRDELINKILLDLNKVCNER